jgi:hypothetical protein
VITRNDEVLQQLYFNQPIPGSKEEATKQSRYRMTSFYISSTSTSQYQAAKRRLPSSPGIE